MTAEMPESHDGFASLKRSGNCMCHLHKLSNLPFRQKKVFIGTTGRRYELHFFS